MRNPAPALLLPLLAAGLAIVVPAEATAQPLPSAVVAYTGQTAPGTGGATYFLLYQPSITRAGDVAFRAELTGAGVTAANNKGHWLQSAGGPVQLFLRAGDPAPPPGTTWSTDVGSPTAQEVSGSARTGFYWGLLDGVTPKGALWSDQPGGPHAVAIQGESAPGIPGATFQPGLPIFDIEFDEVGELLFAASVTGGGTTTANDQGLWLDDGNTTTLVAREGDPAIGFPAGTVFPGIQSPNAHVAPSSRVTFWANPFVPSLGMNQTGIWSNRSGSLAPVVLQGSSAPGLGAGETIGPGAPYANRTGQIAFPGSIFGGAGGFGLWISDPGGSPALAYRAPASDPPFQLLGSQFFLADDGAFYEITNTFASGATRQAIVAITSSGWREIVHVGERVADLNAGIVYSFFDQYFVNGNGQVAFRATISGPGVTGANNKVLVAQGDDLAFHLVARTGDSLEVAPGVFRTVAGLLIPQITGTGPGVLRAFSDNGGLVWMAQTGGISTAILVTNLGVPPAVELVGIEVSQIAQDWNNVVDLVANKKTIVRAHLQSNPAVTVEPVLHARPTGGGVELPLSPLRAEGPDGRVKTSTQAAAERANANLAAFWDLPSEWTAAGDIELEVELLGRPLDCLEGAGPFPFDCKVDAAFSPVPEPLIRLISVGYTLLGTPKRPNLGQELDVWHRMNSALPTPIVDLRFREIDWPGDLAAEPDTCDVADRLFAVKYLNRCFEWLGCTDLYLGNLVGTSLSGCAYQGGVTGAARLLPSPTQPGRQSHVHEVHHMLGRPHTVDPALPALPDGRLQGFCGETSPPMSPEFPYIYEIGGVRRPTLGPLDLGDDSIVFGWDSEQRWIVDPTRYFDLMCYCGAAPIDRWPSRDTIAFAKAAIESRFGGAPLGAPPEGGGAPVLLVPGTVDSSSGTGELAPFVELPDAPTFPAPEPGGYTLRVHRSGGGSEDIGFAPRVAEPDGDAAPRESFLLAIESPATVASVELLEGATQLASRSASANAPVVQVVSPNGGETLGDPTVTISWTGSDADLDPLVYLVQFTPDGGTTWSTLATDRTTTTLEMDRAALAGTADGRIRVQASDGLRTASDVSDASFSVVDSPPQAAILLPSGGQLFYDGQAAIFDAGALDPEDGALSGAALSWTSSLDGVLGTGTPLTLPVDALAEGLHVLTLSAQDSAGNLVQAQTSFRVDQPALLFEDDFESGGTTLWSFAQ